MSEYVIMPKADYVAACNAIRTKTEKTELIKSGDMESEILGIVSGGGSSADVRYVTFLNDDGTVELGKKAVATGDDCADPIARGVFSTPTKESTAQYNYTFYGWATTPNGAADSNWNKAVTEDRTVYANFASVVRYYTITYYDSDGTTVLKTESLAYGSMPSYVPTKEGDYIFSMWTPELTPVSGNANYIATWEEKASFANSSFAKIKEICNAGTASNYFSVGDKKAITLNYSDGTSETINFTIVDMNVDYADLFEKEILPLTIMADNIVSITPTTVGTNSVSNIHKGNVMAKVLTEIHTALPEDLKEVIAAPYYNASNIFIANASNLGVADGAGTLVENNYKKQYKYFANGATIKRTKLTDANVDEYWLASSRSNMFAVVDGTTRLSSLQSASSKQYGVVPCFCL